MDAKTKAEFINSVASGKMKPCPNCSTSNKPDSLFCISCGTKLEPVSEEKDTAVAFAPVTDESNKVNENVKYKEPSTLFAKGLPEWDIEPPQTVVRRHS